MSFIIYAWIASFLFGIEVVIGKLSTKYAVANPWLFNIIWSFFLLLFTIPFAIWNHAAAPVHWGNLVIAGFLYSVFGILYIAMMGKLDVSVLSPLFNFRTAFAAMLGLAMLGEVLTTIQYVYIGMMFVSGLFVSIDERLSLRSFFRWPIVISIGSMFILALAGVYIKKAFGENEFWGVTLWVAILVLAFQLPTLVFCRKDVPRLRFRDTWGITAMALIGTVATVFLNFAYLKNVSITSAINSIPFSMIIAIVMSVYYPKLLEKHSLKVYAVRLSAATVMILCALGLSF